MIILVNIMNIILHGLNQYNVQVYKMPSLAFTVLGDYKFFLYARAH